jgi:hypothetical protein
MPEATRSVQAHASSAPLTAAIGGARGTTWRRRLMPFRAKDKAIGYKTINKQLLTIAADRAFDSLAAAPVGSPSTRNAPAGGRPMPTVIAGPRCNRRVSCSVSPSNDRSESALAINPTDPYHLVAASKKFTDPHTYAFSLIAYVSFDGGQSWKESAPLGLLYDWIGVSDPALAWDNIGNVYLVGLPFGPLSDEDLRGMVVYKSSDGGRTWSPPNHIHNVNGDDKQWAVGDMNPTSPHYGNVYACWDSFGIGDSQLEHRRGLGGLPRRHVPHLLPPLEERRRYVARGCVGQAAPHWFQRVRTRPA